MEDNIKYNDYDYEEMDKFEEPEVKVLSKYDEEIDGEKKKSFTLGQLTLRTIPKWSIQNYIFKKKTSLENF